MVQPPYPTCNAPFMLYSRLVGVPCEVSAPRPHDHPDVALDPAGVTLARGTPEDHPDSRNSTRHAPPGGRATPRRRALDYLCFFGALARYRWPCRTMPGTCRA